MVPEWHILVLLPYKLDPSDYTSEIMTMEWILKNHQITHSISVWEDNYSARNQNFYKSRFVSCMAHVYIPFEATAILAKESRNEDPDYALFFVSHNSELSRKWYNYFGNYYTFTIQYEIVDMMYIFRVCVACVSSNQNRDLGTFLQVSTRDSQTKIDLMGAFIHSDIYDYEQSAKTKTCDTAVPQKGTEISYAPSAAKCVLHTLSQKANFSYDSHLYRGEYGTDGKQGITK